MNTELGMKVNIYLQWEKKPQQITNLKKLTNSKNITKFRKVTQPSYELTAWHASINT